MAQTTEEQAALARIQPASRLAGFPVAVHHRPPRLAVRLGPPDEARNVLDRLVADRQALLEQIEAGYQKTHAHR